MSIGPFIRSVFATVIMLITLTGCTFLNDMLAQDTTPTKTKMEGVWKVTGAFNAQGDSITSRIAFPVTAFHLSSDRTIISTAGPMMMYVVYGNSKYTQIAADIDQVFNYTGLDFNGGEYFIQGGVVSRFTLEMKLEGLPGQKALTDLLGLLGIGNDWLDAVVYHKFMDVRVTFDDIGNEMTWTFDDSTSAVYNTKNSYGNYVLWQGWPVTSFSKCRFVLQKQVTDLQGVVRAATGAKN
jgi:hypothetical protein